MSLTTVNTDAQGYPALSRILAYLPGAVLFVFALLTLGVLDPQLHPVNFDQLTVRTAVHEISAPNVFNQLRWAALAAVASLLVLRDPSRLVAPSVGLRYFLAVLALCVVSAAWSGYPDVTLRRALALIISAYCLLVALSYIERTDRAVLIVYAAFWVALLANLAVLVRAEAFDEVGFYRGIAGNKNTLGSIAALAILYGFAVGRWISGPLYRLARVAYLAAWAGILVLTVSKTSIGLVFVVPALFFSLKLASALLRVSLGTAGLGLVAFGLVILALGHYGAGYTPADFARIVLSDVTLTERTPIWNFMLREIGQSWVLGTGFGAFWGVGYGAPNLKSLYQHIQLINQAHNGYLDVLASLGVVGLGLVFLMIAAFARTAERLRARQGSFYALVWFIILFALLHNLLESSLLVPFNAVWHMTLFALFLAVRAGAEA